MHAMKINNRLMLMILISAGQLACLTGALLWFANWLEGGLIARMRQQVLNSNEQFVTQTVQMIRRMQLSQLRPGTEDWDNVQKIIEHTKLPNDGFLSIIDRENGRILCHPELRHNPILLSMQPGQIALEGSNGNVPLIEAAQMRSPASGLVQLPDGWHLVAVADLPELKAMIIAHQRERGIGHVLSNLRSSIWNVGIVVAVFLVAVSASLTALIVRRYEHKLAALNRDLEQQVERRSHSLMKTRDAVIFGLARLAESRHEDTGEHLERISRYVEILSRELALQDPSLTREMVHTISLASSLHDIGKVGIPDSVLLKAGKLTPRQREVMRRHTLIGGDCLLAIKRRLGEDDFLTTACQIAFSHHERWNGSGYPFGLMGDQIPLAGRIVALADVYDALTSDRVYKCAMSHQQARRMILSAAGKQFDPAVVEAFLRRDDDFAKISAQVSGLTPAQSAA
jgi:putative two-component system response regulator